MSTDQETDPEAQGYRFGFSADSIQRVFREHLKAGVIRAGCYVPTQHEVATEPLDWVVPVLNDWFWESPTELAPDMEQVEQVVAVLRQRRDADDERIQALIEDAPFSADP